MHLMKSVVIGLAVLIFLGLGLLGYGFVQKANNPDWRLFSPSSSAADGKSGAATAKPFGNLNLDLPEGCVIARVRPDGDRAYLTIGPGGECNRIVVVDTVQGRVLGTIKAQPGTSPGTAQ
ncbi:MAG TPA: hypothetical protein QGH84_08160 [Rhodospirillales bacterium]|jgi:hypothetical protein|nr:hypothetical protein [Rhodospirillales bacterium]